MRKMGRLDRLLDDRTDASVELSRAAHRAQDETAIVEVTLLVDGRPLRAVARAASHRAAVDQVVDRLERQVVDLKERRLTRWSAGPQRMSLVRRRDVGAAR